MINMHILWGMQAEYVLVWWSEGVGPMTGVDDQLMDEMDPWCPELTCPGVIAGSPRTTVKTTETTLQISTKG